MNPNGLACTESYFSNEDGSKYFVEGLLMSSLANKPGISNFKWLLMLKVGIAGLLLFILVLYWNCL